MPLLRSSVEPINSKSKGPNSFVWIIETSNNWGLKCIHIFKLGLQNDFALLRILNYWSLNYRGSSVFWRLRNCLTVVTDLEKIYVKVLCYILEAKHNSGELRCPVTALIDLYHSSREVLPFSGRWHKMTHKGWRDVKPQHNLIQIIILYLATRQWRGIVIYPLVSVGLPVLFRITRTVFIGSRWNLMHS